MRCIKHFRVPLSLSMIITINYIRNFSNIWNQSENVNGVY